MIPALTLVLIFIRTFSFWMLILKVERRRRVLGFEAGDHRRLLIQARTRREINHGARIFLAPLGGMWEKLRNTRKWRNRQKGNQALASRFGPEFDWRRFASGE